MSNHEITLTSPTTTVGNHCVATASPASVEQCSSCGSTKRRSLFSSTALPVPKKPALSPSQPPSSSPAASAGHPLEGFRKLELPTYVHHRTTSDPIPLSPENPRSSFPNRSPTRPGTLQRTISDPNPLLLENPRNSISSPSPTRPGALQRTISDPTVALVPPQSPEHRTMIASPVNATAPTSLPPLLPLTSRKMSDIMSSASGQTVLDPIKGGSPSSKELKKMKNIYRVLSEWFSQAIQEVDEEGEENGPEEQEASEFTHNTEYPKEEEEIIQESVSVDRTGECLTIQFKCPCGKGYQILLSGDACFYKLMEF